MLLIDAVSRGESRPYWPLVWNRLRTLGPELVSNAGSKAATNSDLAPAAVAPAEGLLSAVSHQAAVLAAERIGVPGIAVQQPLRGRGWLMRRLLVSADVIGLVAAFLLGIALAPANPAIADRVVVSHEIALFLLSLPFWVLVARIHGLYDRDEERSDHSTIDDFFGVFQVVTIGTWAFLAVTHLLGPAPFAPAPGGILGRRDRARAAHPSGGTPHRPPPVGLRPERDHRRLGRGGTAARRQDREAPRVRAQRRRIRRSRRRGLHERSRPRAAARQTPTTSQVSSARTPPTAS